MAAGLPHFGSEDDRGVEADDVVPLLHHVSPPLALDVVLQLDAERAVVPGCPQAPVDLAGRVHETPSLAQVDDRVKAVTAYGHRASPSGWRSAGTLSWYDDRERQG